MDFYKYLFNTIYLFYIAHVGMCMYVYSRHISMSVYFTYTSVYKCSGISKYLRMIYMLLTNIYFSVIHIYFFN